MIFVATSQHLLRCCIYFIAIVLLADSSINLLSHISFLICCPVIYDYLELWYSLHCLVTPCETPTPTTFCQLGLWLACCCSKLVGYVSYAMNENLQPNQKAKIVCEHVTYHVKMLLEWPWRMEFSEKKLEFNKKKTRTWNKLQALNK